MTVGGQARSSTQRSRRTAAGGVRTPKTHRAAQGDGYWYGYGLTSRIQHASFHVVFLQPRTYKNTNIRPGLAFTAAASRDDAAWETRRGRSFTIGINRHIKDAGLAATGIIHCAGTRRGKTAEMRTKIVSLAGGRQKHTRPPSLEERVRIPRCRVFLRRS